MRADARSHKHVRTAAVNTGSPATEPCRDRRGLRRSVPAVGARRTRLLRLPCADLVRSHIKIDSSPLRRVSRLDPTPRVLAGLAALALLPASLPPTQSAHRARRETAAPDDHDKHTVGQPERSADWPAVTRVARSPVRAPRWRTGAEDVVAGPGLVDVRGRRCGASGPPRTAGHPGITAFVSRVPHRERLGGELVHVRGRSWPGCSRGTPDAGPQVSRSVMGRLAHIAKNSQVPRTPLVRARTRAVMTLCRWRPKGRTQPCVDVHTHARPHQRRRSEVFYRRDSGGS